MDRHRIVKVHPAEEPDHPHFASPESCDMPFGGKALGYRSGSLLHLGSPQTFARHSDNRQLESWMLEIRQSGLGREAVKRPYLIRDLD